MSPSYPFIHNIHVQPIQFHKTQGKLLFFKYRKNILYICPVNGFSRQDIPFFIQAKLAVKQYISVKLYITDRKLWPLQTLLREVVLTMSMAELNAQMADVAAPPSSSVIAATVMVSTVPILAVYPFLQKYFVIGVMVGAVKG